MVCVKRSQPARLSLPTADTRIDVVLQRLLAQRWRDELSRRTGEGKEGFAAQRVQLGGRLSNSEQTPIANLKVDCRPIFMISLFPFPGCCLSKMLNMSKKTPSIIGPLFGASRRPLTFGPSTCWKRTRLLTGAVTRPNWERCPCADCTTYQCFL